MKILILTKREYVSFLATSDPKHELTFFTQERDGMFDDDYDIGISFMWTKRIPKEELDKAPWINFHPAPLPEYKGRNLCYHAIINGETSWGASVHYMDENFDTGDIIEVAVAPLYGHATADYLSELAIAISKDLFIRYIPKILSGEDIVRKENVGGHYYPKEEIPNKIFISDATKDRIRAITYKKFYPVVDIDGVKYKIVRDG